MGLLFGLLLTGFDLRDAKQQVARTDHPRISLRSSGIRLFAASTTRDASSGHSRAS